MTAVTIRKWGKHPYYFLNGDLEEYVVEILQKTLRFSVENAHRTKAFKEGRWDGYECLFYQTKGGTRYFPVGLLAKVTKIFDDLGLDYRIEDITLDSVRDNYKKLGLKWTGFELRDYQQEAATLLLDRGGGMLNAPTGGGKTLVMGKVAHSINLPFLVCVPTKELLYQWDKVIREYFDGYLPYLVGDGRKDFGEITIATIQTLQSMIKRKQIEKLDFPVLVYDECHRVPSETAYMVAMNCNAPFRMGATATAYRTDGADMKMEAALGPISATIDIESLLKRGILATPKFEFLRPATVVLPRRTPYPDAYVLGVVANEERNGMIVEKAAMYARQGHRVYVHVDRIDHGEHLAALIPGAVWLCGRDPTRKRKIVLKKFVDGEFPVLVSTLLKEGVDIPSISVFITGGAGRSKVAVVQRIGRALRAKPGTNEAVIVDFVDDVMYLDKQFQKRYEYYCDLFGAELVGKQVEQGVA